MSGILSRNVGSVKVQSWTGGFSSAGGKRHIGEGKLIPPSAEGRSPEYMAVMWEGRIGR